MKRRSLAAITAAATAIAVVPAMGASAANGDGKTVLTNSGIQRNLDSGNKIAMGSTAAATTPMNLTLQLPLRNQAKIQQLMAKGTVMTPAQYDAEFGVTQAQVNKVTAWAKQQGFTVRSISRGTGQVEVTANAGKVNKAFGVSMKHASLNGVRGLAVDKDPSVPADLGISGVSGLNSVHQMKPMSSRTKDRLAKLGAKPAGLRGGMKTGPIRKLNTTSDGSSDCADYWGQHLYPSALKYGDQSNYICGYTPQQLSGAYGATKFQSKTPVIGVLLWGPDTNVLANTNYYMKEAGYPQLTNYQAVLDKANGQMANCETDVNGEIGMDVQSSHAIAPNSPIRYYGAASCYDNDLTASLTKMVDKHEVSTISMSFGSLSDAGLTAADLAAWDRPFMKAGLTGISTFASSGDDDDNSKVTDGKPHVGHPASSVYTTAVGGTSVGIDKSNKVAGTAAWENSYFKQASPTSNGWTNVTGTQSVFPYDGGGGGVSEAYAQPTWQKGKVNGLSSTKRVVPDVSAIANPYTPFLVRYTSGGQTGYGGIGGTSLASPVLAAMVALAKANNGVQIGNAAPVFYKLAGTSAISDVNAKGKMGASINTQNYGLLVIGFDDKPLSLVSGAGFDNATGVGTPNGAAFYPAFK